MELIQDVYFQLEQLAGQIVERVFRRCPSIRPDVMDIIVEVLQEQRDKTRELVEAVVDAEQNYIFTNDNDYKTSRTNIVTTDGGGQQQQQPQLDAQGRPMNQPPPQHQSGTNAYVREIRARIDTYFKIVLRTCKETVPKLVGQFLVRAS